MDMQQQKLHELIKKEDEKLDKVQDLVDWKVLWVNISLEVKILQMPEKWEICLRQQLCDRRIDYMK